MANGSQYLKASEVAEMLEMDVSSIYKLCDRMVIPSIRIGEKARRIPRAALQAYLARQVGAPSPGRALLEEARSTPEDALTSLECQAQSFYQRAHCSAHDFVEGWRAGHIEDNPETANFLIEALSLRGALDRAGIGNAVPA